MKGRTCMMNKEVIMIRISLCMIVRDEEAVLGRLLEKVSPVMDEIVIVDTGSSDGTRDIALKYTPLVFDFQWKDDFAAARNFACEKASMEYWMWLDADDMITDGNIERIRKLKEELESDTDVVMMKYAAGFDETGAASFSYYRERILRKAMGFVWKGRVHEAITPAGKIVHTDVEIEHRKERAGDPDRNLRIYERMIAEGESFDARSTFYYGRELLYHARYREAAAVLERFLDMKDGWNENRIDACLQAARCFEKTGDGERRIKLLLRSLLYDVPRAEICCELGRALMEKNEFEMAAYWYAQALTAPERTERGGFEQKEYHDFIPLVQLCICYDRMGDLNAAWQYHLRAAVLRPDNEFVRINQKYFEKALAAK